MNLTLLRKYLTDKSTIGELHVDDQFECYTLEDVVRAGPKIPGRTAIPAGTYEIVVTWSDRFKEPMPLLLNVPGFSGIRIHAGNQPEDTDGCILVGRVRGENWLGFSRAAYEPLFEKIKAGMQNGKVYITVTNPA